MYHYKTIVLYITNINVSPQLEIRADPITKTPNNEAHINSRDINGKQPMVGVNDLITNRTGKIIQKWHDKENFILTNVYEATHKEGGN